MGEALWGARPAQCSRRVWALTLALDALPWPLGEDLLARMFRTVGALRPSRWRRALAWAAEQPGRDPRRLAAELCEFRGRWVAQAGLLGVRCPDDLRPISPSWARNTCGRRGRASCSDFTSAHRTPT